jgi:rhodanese-related sulfurtransferase
MQVRSLTPFEAKSLVKNKGYVLLDVRKPEDFAKRHARGAINVPLFKNAEVRQ